MGRIDRRSNEPKSFGMDVDWKAALPGIFEREGVDWIEQDTWRLDCLKRIYAHAIHYNAFLA